MLALRDEFQKQSQAKDKQIEDLTRENSELISKIDQDKLAAVVADAVGKRVEEKNAAALADLRSRLDAITQALRSGAAAPSSPGPGPGPGAPNTPFAPQPGPGPGAPTPRAPRNDNPPPKMQNPSGEDRKHIKMDFGN